MRELTFQCAHCGHQQAVPVEYAGRSATCPKCQQNSRVPLPGEKPPKPAIATKTIETPPAPATLSKAAQRQFEIGDREPQITRPRVGVLTAFVVIQALLFAAFAFIVMTKGIPQRPVSPDRWEYQIVSPDDALLGLKLDELGREGWDFCFARRASDSSNDFQYEIILKRRLAESR